MAKPVGSGGAPQPIRRGEVLKPSPKISAVFNEKAGKISLTVNGETKEITARKVGLFESKSSYKKDFIRFKVQLNTGKTVELLFDRKSLKAALPEAVDQKRTEKELAGAAKANRMGLLEEKLKANATPTTTASSTDSEVGVSLENYAKSCEGLTDEQIAKSLLNLFSSLGKELHKAHRKGEVLTDISFQNISVQSDSEGIATTADFSSKGARRASPKEIQTQTNAFKKMIQKTLEGVVMIQDPLLKAVTVKSFDLPSQDELPEEVKELLPDIGGIPTRDLPDIEGVSNSYSLSERNTLPNSLTATLSDPESSMRELLDKLQLAIDENK